MIRAIIVDDEQHCIDTIEKLAKDYSTKISIVRTFKTVNEAITGTRVIKPDLVFLDVEIKDKTGFDYLEELKDFNFQVVFTTAYNKICSKSF